MAAVYRARHRVSGLVCAVKILHPASIHSGDLEDVKRFKREFQTVSRLDHPNVVKVYEAGVEDRTPWIAMELIEGVDLDGLLARWQVDPPPNRMDLVEHILRGLCEAFAYLHGLGLIHRDLKPGNVLVDHLGNPKLTDFGVVKNPEATWTQLTVAGKLVGTVAFMAPEQITNDQVGPRADLYALGAVLYMMLTFKRPIQADTLAGYLARHLSEVPVSPSQIDPMVPARLEAVCQKLLRKEPDQRFASARAVLAALDADGNEAWPLRGRDELIEHLTAQLRALSGGASAVFVLRGPEGAGRTALLNLLAVEGAAAGVEVVRLASGAPLPPLDEQPALVLADDLDQHPELIDDLATAVRSRLSVGHGPLLLIGATADDTDVAISGVVSGLSTGLPAEVLELPPLERRAIVALLRDRHVGGAAAPVLGRRLHEDYHGLPGPVVEQLDALVAEQWLTVQDGMLQAAVAIDDLRAVPLPIPARVRQALQQKVDDLRANHRDALTYLGALGRPAALALLQRCTGDDDVEDALRTLVREGLAIVQRDEDQEVFATATPAVTAVAVASLTADARVHVHGRIVRAIGTRRRNAPALELAEHLLLANQPGEAFRQLVIATRRVARAQRPREVLDLCARSQALLPSAEALLPAAELLSSRRWLHELAGEACLALARWDDAASALTLAVADARQEGDVAALARTLAALGRAHYRRGSFEVAQPLLDEALACAPDASIDRANATRALADIALQRGELDASEALWREALTLTEAAGSRSGQARAQRGLAHLAAVRCDLPGCAVLLDRADELLHPDGDPWVRAGVLVRRIELDWAAGRFVAGLRRAEALLEHVQNHDMPERLPLAHALLAELHATLGQDEQVHRQIRNALTYATTIGDRSWDARLRVARLLCVYGRREEALEALPPTATLPSSHVDGPSTQRAAIEARCRALSDASTAADLARWVSVRPAPLLAVRGAEISVDIAWALADVGDIDGARRVAKDGLRNAQHAEMDGLRLGLLVALFHARPDERVKDTILQIATRIASELPRELRAGFQATLNPR